MRRLCCSLICCGRRNDKSPVQPIIRLVPDEESPVQSPVQTPVISPVQPIIRLVPEEEEPKVKKLTLHQKVVEKAPRPPKAKPPKPLKPLKPGKVQKPTAPKKKVKPQKKTTSSSEATSSNEEYSLPSPPLHNYRTDFTPEISGVHLNSAEYSDIEVSETSLGSDSELNSAEHIDFEMEETSPGDGLLIHSPEELLNSTLEEMLMYSAGIAQKGMEHGKSSSNDTSEVLPFGWTKEDQKPSAAQVATYRAKGAQLQRWLEDPNEPNCYISPIMTTINDLLQAPSPRTFEVGSAGLDDPCDLMDGGEPESVGLITTGHHYRYTTISDRVTDPKVLEAFQREYANNSYAHICGPGLLVAHSIFRYDNFQWNEIGHAVYTIDRPIDTLKYIMFRHVINEETEPYILKVLYPRLGLRFKIQQFEPCQKIERGTPEYEELLGTKLGKAAAILLISSLPRGTRRIARAVIWNVGGKIMVRFEVESTTDEEIPGDPKEAPGEAPDDHSYASDNLYEESEGG
ncbi:uncharacterized protein PGRI_032640 [Penicillium griseofulvum]|uniref:Uncharacterized protein n=1 Tax=Penicillium patulum TaxID=5078 RepID=A0A135LKC7_PENPA|nr:uncharacterized protein PGRI_032640 [Penicillium griseofulvum]KXG49394.1 hypothetical protein PGRI_032640 [Penicillium griseofulvum]